jgi:GT2 family glycosyltransferase
MVSKKIIKASVLIATRDRPELLKKCLNSILQSSVFPDEIIIVEDSCGKGSADKKYLKKISKHGVKIRYYVLNNRANIAISRNCLLKKAKNNLCVFIDDDVSLGRNTLNDLYNLHHKRTKTVVIGGVGCPEKSDNIYSKFIYELIYGNINRMRGKLVNVEYCPTMIFSIKKDVLVKNNIWFDERFLSLEDIDICIRLRKMDGEVMVAKNIKVTHKYRENAMSFIKTFRWYYQSAGLLKEKYGLDILTGYTESKSCFKKIGYLFLGKCWIKIDIFGVKGWIINYYLGFLWRLAVTSTV